MATFSVTYTFIANTKARAAEVNQDFTDVLTILRSHHHDPNIYTNATPITNSGIAANAQILDTQLRSPITRSGLINDASIQLVTVPKGGTGLMSMAAGDMIYADSANIMRTLPIGSNGQYLSIASGRPSWVAVQPGYLADATMLAGESISANQSLYIKKDAGSGTYDTSDIIEGQSSGFTRSVSVGVNSNRIMLVQLTQQGGTKATSISISYGGQAMTAVQSFNYSGSAWQFTFILVAPATGSNNLTATWSGGASLDATTWVGYGFTQSTTPDATNTASGSGTSYSGSITTVADGSWVITFTGNTSGGTLTSGTNMTKRAGFGRDGVGDSAAAITPAGSTSITASSSASAPYGLCMISLSPITAPAYRAFKASSAASGSANSFYGFAQGAVSLGQTVTAIVAGVMSGFSALTPGSQYYLNDTAGTIGTSAGTVSRKVGIAISTTQLLITNNW